MTFVERDDVLQIFENMIRGLFKESVNYDLGEIPVLTYAQALETY